MRNRGDDSEQACAKACIETKDFSYYDDYVGILENIHIWSCARWLWLTRDT